MGPQGGDEVNLIVAGRNYGWPKASNGSHYGGADIPDHAAGDGYEPPKSGGTRRSRRRADRLFGQAVAAVEGRPVHRRAFEQGAAARRRDRQPMPSRATNGTWARRIREVEEAPDGALLVLEDGGRGSSGRLLKLLPK